MDLRFIRPGKPIENAYVESFNGKVRDECLNEHWFVSLGGCVAIEVERCDRAGQGAVRWRSATGDIVANANSTERGGRIARLACIVSALGNEDTRQDSMRSHIWYFVTAIICLPSSVMADPVTVRYNITITERCHDPTGFDRQCAPFTAPDFLLTLSFDNTHGAGGDFLTFGRPSFSDVPLSLPDVTAPSLNDGFSSYSRFRTDGSEIWTGSADAYQATFSGSAEFPRYGRVVRLSATQYSSDPPHLDFLSMVELLGSEQDRSFIYSALLEIEVGGGVLGFDGVQYFGRAVLVDAPDPVPEPATLALLTIGGVVCAARRVRRKHAQTPRIAR